MHACIYNYYTVTGSWCLTVFSETCMRNTSAPRLTCRRDACGRVCATTVSAVCLRSRIRYHLFSRPIDEHSHALPTYTRTVSYRSDPNFVIYSNRCAAMPSRVFRRFRDKAAAAPRKVENRNAIVLVSVFLYKMYYDVYCCSIDT